MFQPAKFAQAELRGIVVHALEAEFAAELFEIKVVALRQCIRHVHAETSEMYRRVARDEAFAAMPPKQQKA